MADYRDYGFFDESLSYPHAYIHKPLLSMLSNKPDRLILDLGCGNGAMVKFLIDRGWTAYGTDASEMGISIARQAFPGRFELQDLSADDLPEAFKHLHFNTIISTEVIEHLYHPRKLIALSKAILLSNGGGDLIISTPYHGYLKNLLIAFAGRCDAHFNPLWDGGHIKYWSRKTLGILLAEAGFRVTEFRGCGRLPGLWKSMLIKAEINNG